MSSSNIPVDKPVGVPAGRFGITSEELSQLRQAFHGPDWYLRGAEYNIKIRAETVKAFVRNNHFDSILDIGCGDGSLSLPLLNADSRLTLLDQSRAMLRIARARIPAELASQAQTVQADFMDVPLEDRRFDLILCVGVLAYIERRRECLAKIKTLLKPGGSVVLECTDADHFLSRVILGYETLRRALRPTRLRTMVGSSADIVSLFQGLGFQLVDSFRYSLPPPVVRKVISQKLSYQTIRFIFGTARHNRNPWLGNECLYHFEDSSK